MTRNKHLERVRICLFEPLGELGGPMTSMLRIEGFKQTNHIYTLDSLRSEIRVGMVDVLLMEADEQESDIARIARSVRLGKLGENPFLVLIAAQSDVTLKSAQVLSLAGIDAILDKPYSAHTVLTHLLYLARRPRQFVVNGPYAGPERRAAARAGDTSEHLDVPNALEAILQGTAIDPDKLAQASADWARLVEKVQPLPKDWPDRPTGDAAKTGENSE